MTFAASTTTPAVGDVVTLTGDVKPATEGKTVWLQIKNDSGWSRPRERDAGRRRHLQLRLDRGRRHDQPAAAGAGRRRPHPGLQPAWSMTAGDGAAAAPGNGAGPSPSPLTSPVDIVTP